MIYLTLDMSENVGNIYIMKALVSNASILLLGFVRYTLWI